MNPSAKGWVRKLLATLSEKPYWSSFESLEDELIQCGFISGNHQRCLIPLPLVALPSEEEIAKVNLLIGHHAIYYLFTLTEDFEYTLLAFYEELNLRSTKKDKRDQIEQLIQLRIHPKGVQLKNLIQSKPSNASIYLDLLLFYDYCTLISSTSLASIHENELVKRFEPQRIEKERPVNYYRALNHSTTRLIYRNKDRIKKEIQNNKRLVELLNKYTVQKLNAEEKRELRKIALEVFKSIPSIAIFMLPGGSVLLPIAIRLLPKLKPSSFDDNRIE